MTKALLNPYDFPLKAIQGTSFTKREIDVIACLTSGRSLKGISNFLGIHYKTLEVHMANIRQKLGISVRDYIIEVLENLPELALLKCRYQQLQQLGVLQKELQKTALKQAIIFYTASTKNFAYALQKHLAPLATKVCLWKGKRPDDPFIFLTLTEIEGGISLSNDLNAENNFYYSVLKILNPSFTLNPSLSIPISTNPSKKAFQKKWLLVAALILGFIFYYFLPSIKPLSSSLLERPSIQQSILEEFKKTSSSTNPLVILVGTGGIGKTTAARNFLKTNHFHWELNAETKTTLMSGYRSLAHQLAQQFNLMPQLEEILSIQNAHSQETEILTFVQNALKKNPWTLLYDNVETWTEVIPYLPLSHDTWGKGKILITSRNQIVPHFASRIIEIPTLTDEEKLSLFLKFYAKEKQKNETTNFLKNIPPFPLDILLAASYLNAIDISYDDYLKRLQHSSDHFNHLQASLHDRSTRHQIIVQAIESITKTNPSYSELFLLCCLLDADDLPLKILENHSSSADEFIYHMKKHSLLKSSKEGFFFIHRSTQHHGLVYFSHHLTPLVLKSVLMKSMDSLEKTYQQILQKDKAYSLNLLHHLESFKEKIKTLSIAPSSKMTLIIRINILRASIYDKALSHIQKVKKILSKTLLLDEKINVLKTTQKKSLFVDLAHMHGLSGNFHEAIHYYKKGLTFSSPEDRAKGLISIGFEYVWLNQFDQAKHYLESGIVEAQKLTSPNKNQLIGDGYAFLATLYSTTFLDKEEKTALAYLEKAEKIVQSLPNHERLLLRLYRNKAQVYCRGNHYKESLEHCIKPAREILKNLSGPSHNLLRLSLDACEGEILLRQGKVTEARNLLEKTVQKYLQLLGKDDAFMLLYPLVHYIESLIKNREFKKAQEYIELATQMKNPAYTNFHKFLYQQLDQHRSQLTP